MVFYSFSDLNNPASPNATDAAWQAGQQVADAVCEVWQNNAGFLTGFPDPTGIGQFNTGVFDSLCSPRQSNPPTPVPQFSGGQCDIFYDLVVQYGSSRGGPNDSPQTIPVNGTTTYQSVLGPIGGGFVRGNPGGFGYQGVVQVPPQAGAPDGFLLVWTSSDPDFDDYEGAFCAVASAVPSSGGPDTCGDPPPTFPVVLPPLIFINKPINLQIGPISIPTRLVFNRNNFRPRFDIRPQIEFNAGPFNFNFDLGGLNVEFSPNFNFPSSPSPPLLPPSSPPGGGGGGGKRPSDKEDAEEIKEEVEKARECACDDPPDVEVEELAFDETEGASFSLPGPIVQINLNLVKITNGVKSQWGRGSAPDVYFAGWYAFSRGGGEPKGDRLPISFAQNELLPPTEDCTGFAFSLNYNCTAQGLIKYLKQEEEE